MLFVSGQTGKVPGAGLAEGGLEAQVKMTCTPQYLMQPDMKQSIAKANCSFAPIRPQADQTLKNLGAVLEAGGFAYSNCVKCTVLLTTMEHFDRVNKVRGGFSSVLPPLIH